MGQFVAYDYNQLKLIPVLFSEQILPESFEYTLCYLIDREVDMSIFEARYKNDVTGRPAYDPALLLKIVLYAYSKGVTSSRRISELCKTNIVFIALSADTRPHFATIAGFVSANDGAMEKVFRDILLVCDTQGLIGREMFAIDGVKLPSNASKEWSGTREEFSHKVSKIQRAVQRMLATHRSEDTQALDTDEKRRAHELKQTETLRAQVKKLKDWLKENEDKPGNGTKPRKSNVTDNDSAKMKTGHGTIQGYAGVATVDVKHQVVVQSSCGPCSHRADMNAGSSPSVGLFRQPRWGCRKNP
ncbi:MAG: transposase [Chromatiales bacterium]|jgi:transposase|nr:transposase [Chromatiales bacterium]